MGQRSVPAPFLTKTYQLVGDTGSDDVISWGENGDSFVVWKMADFAKDLLPKYFKHNNFSSFVRQLNTYGFRKVVPDKWEFANDNFKKGQPELLSKIRRRKAVVVQTKQQQQQKGVASNPAATTTAVNNGSLTVTVNNPCADQTSLSAGDEMGSTSTSSASKGAPGSLDSNGSNQLTRIGSLDDSNEKLRRDNENLRTELERSKKQCDGLVEFLTKQLKVGPNQINRIMYGSSRSNDGGSCSDEEMTCLDDSGIQDKKNVVEDDDENERSDDDEMEECVGDDDDDRSRHNLKLFGVLLKGCKGAAHDGGRNKKKRARVENMTTSAVTEGGAAAAAAAADHHHHQQLCWMRRIVSAAPGETSKVGFRRL